MRLKRTVVMALMLALAVAGILIGYRHFTDVRADRAFGKEAIILQGAVEGLPAARAAEITLVFEDWMDALRSLALQLRSARKRELALKWLVAYERLQVTGQALKDAEGMHTDTLRWCWERIGRDPDHPYTSRPTNEEVAFLVECRGDADREYEKATKALLVEAKRLQAEVQTLWARLLAIAPMVGQARGK